MPADDGDNGDVLVSDGSGNLSFSAPAASTITLAADSGSDDTFYTGGDFNVCWYFETKLRPQYLQ